MEKKENLDRLTEKVKQKVQQRCNNCLDTETNKNNTIKIKCLEQTARNLQPSQANTNIKNASKKEEIENFQKEIYRTKVQHDEHELHMRKILERNFV
jgi:hypothetical protein